MKGENIQLLKNLVSATHKRINFYEVVLKNVKPHPVIDLIHKKKSVTVGRVVVYSQFPEVLFGSAWPTMQAVTQFHISIIGFNDLQYRDGESKHNLIPFIKTTDTVGEAEQELPALAKHQRENG